MCELTSNPLQDTIISYNPNGTVMYNGVKLQVNDTSESLERDATIQVGNSGRNKIEKWLSSGYF